MPAGRSGKQVSENIIEGYKLSDLDTASDPSYYGYVDASEGWYIVEENSANETYRYVKGLGSYSTAWTNRASQSYDYYFNEF